MYTTQSTVSPKCVPLQGWHAHVSPSPLLIFFVFKSSKLSLLELFMEIGATSRLECMYFEHAFSYGTWIFTLPIRAVGDGDRKGPSGQWEFVHRLYTQEGDQSCLRTEERRGSGNQRWFSIKYIISLNLSYLEAISTTGYLSVWTKTYSFRT